MRVAAAKQEQAFLAEFGIESELLDRQAISALEPNILPVYKVGLLHTQTASVDSPGAVVKAYARMFAGSGGEIRQSDIKAIEPDGDGWRVVLADGAISARHVVVALGPWSADMLRPLGYRVPLAFERGYHQEFKPNPARSLLRPIHDAEGSFLMTPMEKGIRVTSGVELTDRDAPSSFAQLDMVVPMARGVVEFGDGRRRTLARGAADLARQPADDRAGAAASRPVACFRQPAYRLHHRARDGRCDCRDDRGRAAVIRRQRVFAGPLHLMRRSASARRE